MSCSSPEAKLENPFVKHYKAGRPARFVICGCAGKWRMRSRPFDLISIASQLTARSHTSDRLAYRHHDGSSDCNFVRIQRATTAAVSIYSHSFLTLNWCCLLYGTVHVMELAITFNQVPTTANIPCGIRLTLTRAISVAWRTWLRGILKY